MDLTLIPDLGPTYAQMLREAGIGSVASLAGVADLEPLARSTRIHAATLETFRAHAREFMERALSDAGIQNMSDLADADLDALAATLDVDRAHLEGYQQAARDAVSAQFVDAGYAHPDDIAAADADDVATRTGLPRDDVVRYQTRALDDISERLAAAGLGEREALADVDDDEDAAERAGLRVETVARLVADARASVEASLLDAGVGSIGELRDARDLDAIAEKSGLSEKWLHVWQQRFAEPAEFIAPPETYEATRSANRVVLREGSAKAVVIYEQIFHEEIPLVTVRFADDETSALARAGPNAVVLKEKADTAGVRIEGQDVGQLPIFKRDEDGHEQRVRVASLRERVPAPAAAERSEEPAPAKGGNIFQRFLGKRRE